MTAALWTPGLLIFVASGAAAILLAFFTETGETIRHKRHA